MFSRILGCAMIGLALCTFALEAGGTKEKDKVDSKKDSGKTTPELKGVVGTVKSVNMEKGTFTLAVTTATDTKKEVKFTVNEDTKFIGPKGGNRGMGKDGLKDDCMEKGHEVRVIASKDSKTVAAEVHLPTRKTEKTVEKDKVTDKK